MKDVRLDVEGILSSDYDAKQLSEQIQQVYPIKGITVLDKAGEPCQLILHLADDTQIHAEKVREIIKSHKAKKWITVKEALDLASSNDEKLEIITEALKRSRLGQLLYRKAEE